MNFFKHTFQGFELDFNLLFIVLFLGIISWKGASRFNGGGGGSCLSDGRASFLSGECTPWKSLVLMEEGGFEKNRRMGGACSPLWETLYCVGVFFAHGYTKLIFAVPTTHDQ